MTKPCVLSLLTCCLSSGTSHSQEPIIVWSFIIGGVGLGLPLVVPPIREAMGYGAPTPKAPPPVRTVRPGLGSVPPLPLLLHTV